MESFVYNYVPRYSGIVKPEAPAAASPWAASPKSPGYCQKQVAPTPAPAPVPYPSMIQPQLQPQLYYATQPVAEPVKHNFWYGGTKAEVDAQNATAGAANPVRVVPQANLAAQQYYCRELDGSYTLRSTKEIMESLQPGYWTFANPGGYPYWVRSKAA